LPVLQLNPSLLPEYQLHSRDFLPAHVLATAQYRNFILSGTTGDIIDISERLDDMAITSAKGALQHWGDNMLALARYFGTSIDKWEENSQQSGENDVYFDFLGLFAIYLSEPGLIVTFHPRQTYSHFFYFIFPPICFCISLFDSEPNPTSTAPFDGKIGNGPLPILLID
jgi:hypothetical protein